MKGIGITSSVTMCPTVGSLAYFVRGIDQRESKYRPSDLGGKAGHCRIADDVLVVLEKPGIDSGYAYH